MKSWCLTSNFSLAYKGHTRKNLRAFLDYFRLESGAKPWRIELSTETFEALCSETDSQYLNADLLGPAIIRYDLNQFRGIRIVPYQPEDRICGWDEVEQTRVLASQLL